MTKWKSYENFKYKIYTMGIKIVPRILHYTIYNSLDLMVHDLMVRVLLLTV